MNSSSSNSNSRKTPSGVGGGPRREGSDISNPGNMDSSTSSLSMPSSSSSLSSSSSSSSSSPPSLSSSTMTIAERIIAHVAHYQSQIQTTAGNNLGLGGSKAGGLISSSLKQDSSLSKQHQQQSETAIDSSQFASHVRDIFIAFISSKYIGIDGISDDLLDSAVYEHLVELFDKLFDDVDIRLESGPVKKKISDVMNLILTVDKDRLLAAYNHMDIPKPQLSWSDIDNRRREAFIPKVYDPVRRLKMTPQDVVPTNDVVVLPTKCYPHPYISELNALNYSTESFADLSLLKPWLSSSTQPFVYVDSESGLTAMIDDLRTGCSEIALRLKSNSYRSFQGITCCIQISSRFKDYFIDTIRLRDCMHRLNAITTDSGIVKILHQGESQILWLQRDFGVYVVNAFDTFHAAKLLRYPALSLAHLLKIFCAVTISKKYQLADWRERPLPADMIENAKAESHYLLYIYDHTRREVWDSHGREGLRLVFQATRKTCMQRYEKDGFWPLGYRKVIPSSFLSRYSSSISATSSSSSSSKLKVKSISLLQDAVMGKLWDWRDQAARNEDESIHFIMSNTELLYIGMEVPITLPALEACAFLSHYVRLHAEEVIALVIMAVQEAQASKSKISLSRLTTTTSQSTSSSNLMTTPTKQLAPSKISNANSQSLSSYQNAINTTSSSPIPSSSSNGLNTAPSQVPLYGRALHTPSKELLLDCDQDLDQDIYDKGVVAAGLLLQQQQQQLQADMKQKTYQSLTVSTDSQLFSDLYNSKHDIPEFSVVRSIDSSIKLMSVAELFRQCGWDNEGDKTGTDSLEFRLSNKEFGPESLAPLNTKKLQEARAEIRNIAYKILTTFLGPNALNIVNANTIHQADTSSSSSIPSSSPSIIAATAAASSISSTVSQDKGSSVNTSFDCSRFKSLSPTDYTITEVEMSEEDLFDSLPTSFVDIYNLSNDIRKKNRDKKKGSGKEESCSTYPWDIEDSESDSESNSSSSFARRQQYNGLSSQAKSRVLLLEKIGNSCDMDGVLFDDNIYYEFMKLERDSTNLGVDGALDAASEFGWIKDPAHRQSLFEAFTTEQAQIQSESTAGDDESGGGWKGGSGAQSQNVTYNPTPISPRVNTIKKEGYSSSSNSASSSSSSSSGGIGGGYQHGQGESRKFHPVSQSLDSGISSSSSSSSSLSFSNANSNNSNINSGHSHYHNNSSANSASSASATGQPGRERKSGYVVDASSSTGSTRTPSSGSGVGNSGGFNSHGGGNIHNINININSNSNYSSNNSSNSNSNNMLHNQPNPGQVGGSTTYQTSTSNSGGQYGQPHTGRRK